MTRPLDHFCAHPEDDKRLWPLWATMLLCVGVCVPLWAALGYVLWRWGLTAAFWLAVVAAAVAGALTIWERVRP